MLHNLILAAALAGGTPSPSVITNTIYNADGTTWVEAACVNKALATLTHPSTKFVDIQIDNASVFAKAQIGENGYTAGIRCDAKHQIIFVVVSGFDYNQTLEVMKSIEGAWFNLTTHK